MTKYDFFQLFPKWPVWVEKMCSGVLEGPSTCVLPISKLITAIFHDYKKISQIYLMSAYCMSGQKSENEALILAT